MNFKNIEADFKEAKIRLIKLKSEKELMFFVGLGSGILFLFLFLSGIVDYSSLGVIMEKTGFLNLNNLVGVGDKLDSDIKYVIDFIFALTLHNIVAIPFIIFAKIIMGKSIKTLSSDEKEMTDFIINNRDLLLADKSLEKLSFCDIIEFILNGKDCKLSDIELENDLLDNYLIKNANDDLYASYIALKLGHCDMVDLNLYKDKIVHSIEGSRSKELLKKITLLIKQKEINMMSFKASLNSFILKEEGFNECINKGSVCEVDRLEDLKIKFCKKMKNQYNLLTNNDILSEVENTVVLSNGIISLKLKNLVSKVTCAVKVV